MASDADFAFIRRMARAQWEDEPLNADQLAEFMKVSPALVSQRLRRLEREGLVARRQTSTRAGRAVLYVPKAWAKMQWSSPAEGVAVTWETRREVDWEFPLLSQIPDDGAASTVRAFLGELRARGRLDARTSVPRPGTKIRKADCLGLTAVVYGSTARGPARPGADVDIFAFYRDDRAEVMRDIHDAAAQVSLYAARPIQLLLFNWDGDASKVSAQFLTELRKDGLIVHDGLRVRAGGPSHQFWRLIYGGRLTD